MRLRTFLAIAAALYAMYGLGLALVPATFMAVYGVELDSGGSLIARILGAALIGFALIFWWSRDEGVSDRLQAVLRASFVYNVIDLPIVLLATVQGVMSAVGWSAVVLHLLLASGFGYFGFVKR